MSTIVWKAFRSNILLCNIFIYHRIVVGYFSLKYQKELKIYTTVDFLMIFKISFRLYFLKKCDKSDISRNADRHFLNLIFISEFIKFWLLQYNCLYLCTYNAAISLIVSIMYRCCCIIDCIYVQMLLYHWLYLCTDAAVSLIVSMYRCCCIIDYIHVKMMLLYYWLYSCKDDAAVLLIIFM